MRQMAAAIMLACAPPALAQAPAAPPPPAVTIPDDPALAALVRERLAWIAGGGNSITEVDRLTPQEVVRGAAAAPAPRIDPERRTIATAALGEALALARRTRSQSLIVMRHGKVELEWYAPGFGPDSRSSTASMMKPVMAMAMGAAIAQGAVGGLDEPVARHIAEWRDDPRGAITVRQLLEMNAGLGMTPGAPFRAQDLTLGTDAAGAALAAVPAQPPGSGFQYNNISSQLAGLVIERATGRRFAAFLSEALWRPIGARDAAVWLDRPGGMARTYCCLIATARDWARVGELIRNDGRVGARQVLPAHWVRAMTAASPGNPNFGFQTWRASPYAAERSYGPAIALRVPAAAPFALDDIVYFDGAGGQRVYVSPSAGLTIVRIGAVAGPWDDSALPNAIAPGLIPAR